MASPKLELRAPQALLEAIDAAAERNGRTRSAEALATLGERYLGDGGGDSVPRQPAAPRSPSPPAQVRRASELQPAPVYSERGASMGAAMKAAGIAEYDPSVKRAPYQKGQGAQVKKRR